MRVLSDRRADAAPGLWAITSYFNPIGYESRRRNYRTFGATSKMCRC